MVRAVLFDLDGTLVNSLQDLAEAVNYSLVRHGFEPHGVEEYRYFVGSGVAELIRRTLPEEHRDAATMASVRTQYSAYYAKHYADNTAPYDGIVPLLDALAVRGLKLAIVSNKPDAFSKEIARKLLANVAFDVVIGQSEGLPKKPDPAMPLEAMREMGVSPEECLYIGDSDVDVHTAKNTGVLCAVGCAWGFRGREELLSAGADVVIDTPAELLDVLKGR